MSGKEGNKSKGRGNYILSILRHTPYLDIGLKMPYVIGNQKESKMKEILIFVGFVAGWIILMKYILPKLGVST